MFKVYAEFTLQMNSKPVRETDVWPDALQALAELSHGIVIIGTPEKSCVAAVKAGTQTVRVLR